MHAYATLRWKKWGSPMFDTSRYISIYLDTLHILVQFGLLTSNIVLRCSNVRGPRPHILQSSPGQRTKRPSASSSIRWANSNRFDYLAESCTASDRFWQILTAPSVCARLLWLQTMTPQTIRPGLDMQTVRLLILLLWISVFSLFQELKNCSGISRGRPQPACL